MKWKTLAAFAVVLLMLAVPYTAVAGNFLGSEIGADTNSSESGSGTGSSEGGVGSGAGAVIPADKGFTIQYATPEANNVVNTKGLYKDDAIVQWNYNAGAYRTPEYFESITYSSYGQPLIVEDLTIDGVVRDVLFATSSAVDAKTGEVLWTAPSNGIYQLKGPVYYNGVLFEETSGGQPALIAISAYTGEILASYSIGGFGSTICLSDDGYLYVGSCSGFNTGSGGVYCFDADLKKIGDTYVMNCIWSATSPTGCGYYADKSCVAGDYVVFCDNQYSVHVFDRFTGVLVDMIDFLSTGDGWLNGVFFNPAIGKLYIATSNNMQAFDMDPVTGKLDRNTVMETGFATLTPTYYNGKLYAGVSGKGLCCFDWSTLELKWIIENEDKSLWVLNTEKDDGDGEVYLYASGSSTGGAIATVVKDSNDMKKGEVYTTIKGSLSQFVFTGLTLWDGGIYMTVDGGNTYGYVVTDKTAYVKPTVPATADGKLTVVVDSIKNIGTTTIDNTDETLTVRAALEAALAKIDTKMAAKWDDNGLVQFRFDRNMDGVQWVYALWDAAASKWTFTKTLTGNELAKDYTAVGLYYAYTDGDKITVYSNSTPTNTTHYKSILFQDGAKTIWTHVCGVDNKADAIKAAVGMIGDTTIMIDSENANVIKGWNFATYSASGGYTGYWSTPTDPASTGGTVWAFYTDLIPAMQMFDAFKPVEFNLMFDAGSILFKQEFFADGVRINEVIADAMALKGVEASLSAAPTFMGLPNTDDYVWKIYVYNGTEYAQVTDLDVVATNDIKIAYESVDGPNDSDISTMTFLVENTVTPFMGWYSGNLATVGEIVGTIVLDDRSGIPLDVVSVGDVANTADNVWNTYQWMNGGWKSVFHLGGGSYGTIYAMVYGPVGTMPSYLVDTPYTKDFVASDATGTVKIESDVPAYAYYNAKITAIEVAPGVTSIGDYAFYNTGLTSVTLPESVTSIGDYAFFGCELTSVTLGKKIHYVGENALDSRFLPEFQVKDLGNGKGMIIKYNGAGGNVIIPGKLGNLTVTAVSGGVFLDNKTVTAITIPDTVVEIGVKAFSGTAITTLNIESENISIMAEAFANCESLKSVTFTKDVGCIGAHAFAGCSSLDALALSGDVSVLGAYAFTETAVKSFKVPESVTDVPMGLFKDSALETLDLGKAVTVGDHAFDGTSVKALVIPETVTKIGAHAFQFIDASELTIPKTVTTIGDYAFYGTDGMKVLTFEAGREAPLIVTAKTFGQQSGRDIVAHGYFTEEGGKGTKWDNRITPEGGKYYSHTAAPPSDPKEIYGYELANGRVNLTGLKIPMAVLEIPDFIEIDGVDYPVFSIGGNAFRFSDNLVEVHLPKHLASIGAYAFADCGYLTAFEFNEALTSIGDYAFSNTPLGGYVHIPNVATVGNYAFNQSEITGVEFGTALKTVGSYAFGYTDKLKDVVFAEGAKPTFTYYAFYAAGMESLYIPSGYTLAQRVFSGCTNLLYVTLGDDVTGPNSGYPFEGSAVQVIRAGSGLTVMNQGLGGAPNLSTVIIEDSERINANAFYKAKDLQEIYFFCDAPEFVGGYLAAGNYTIYYLAEYADTWVDAEGKPLLSNLAKYPHKVFNGIKFLMNDGTGSAYFMDDITSFRVPAMLEGGDAPARTGYEFAGWYTDEACTVAFDLDDYSEFTGGVLNVYAKWTPVVYDIVYELNGGTYTGPDTYTYAEPVELGIPVRDGAEFMGWYFESDFTGGVVTSIPSGKMGDVALYARWSDSDYLYNIEYGLSGTTSLTITSYDGIGKEVVVPAEIDGVPVVAIGDRAFEGRTVTSVTLPDGVVSIGNFAFNNCSSLKTVTMGEGIETIGDNVFDGCIVIEDIVIPEDNTQVKFEDGILYAMREFTAKSGNRSQSVTTLAAIDFFATDVKDVVIKAGAVGANAFAAAKIDSLTAVDEDGNPYKSIWVGTNAFQNSTIRSICTVGNIMERGFQNCNSLEEVVIESNSLVISQYAFYNCQKLKSINIPAGVTEIPTYAFYGCALESIDLSGTNVSSIGNYAFGYSRNLATITLPTTAIEFWRSPFQGCSALESIAIPDGSVIAASNMLQDCASLKEVSIGRNVHMTNTDYMFSGCSSLEEVTLGHDFHSIGKYMFQNCTSLKSVEILDGVTSINDGAFIRCSALESIVVPPSVTKIGKYAFQDCSALKTVLVYGDVNDMGNGVFRNINSEAKFVFMGDVPETFSATAWDKCPITTTLYVMPENLEAWKAAEPAFPGTVSALVFDIGVDAGASGNKVALDLDLSAKQFPALEMDAYMVVYVEFEGADESSSVFMKNTVKVDIASGETAVMELSGFSKPKSVSVMLYTGVPADGGVLMSQTVKEL